MLTLEQYTLYTGQTVSFLQSDWEAIVSIAEMRLASFLCLEEFPELTAKNKDLAMLLSNFMAAVFKFQGDGDAIESKSVRNFTINFKSNSAADAFSQIASQYQDIIDKYSQCDLGVKVERSRRYCCGNFYGCI
ncbi:hypothetical protein IKG38_03610 [Candidatus Saccharibacteria bacterium]|nr:hypothetical protein [Candidatus Saccharibacteria bacterium]